MWTGGGGGCRLSALSALSLAKHPLWRHRPRPENPPMRLVSAFLLPSNLCHTALPHTFLYSTCITCYLQSICSPEARRTSCTVLVACCLLNSSDRRGDMNPHRAILVSVSVYVHQLTSILESCTTLRCQQALTRFEFDACSPATDAWTCPACWGRWGCWTLLPARARISGAGPIADQWLCCSFQPSIFLNEFVFLPNG
jgi:hypothetical protein